MIITISGRAGSGKSTVAKLVAKKLGYSHYSMGDLRRNLAKERGLSLAELLKHDERGALSDEEMDSYQRKLGEKEDNFVIDSRLGFHFIPGSVKVFIDANLKVRTQRAFQDKRVGEKFRNLGEAEKAVLEREKSDKKRYRKYYKLDPFNKSHYDLVVDSSRIPAKKVAEKILEFVKK